MNFDQEFFDSQAENLTLPAVKNDVYMPLRNWRAFSKKERRFIDAKVKYIEQQRQKGFAIDLKQIWDGDGENPNAALTIFRHFDSSTVEQGLLGPAPKTAWLLNYHLLERIHYLLVAGYDVYGNLGHQYITRTYMDFLRMEGESAFLYLLPKAAQDKELADWYQGAEQDVVDYMNLRRNQNEVPNNIVYDDSDAKSQLFDKLNDYLAPVLNPEFSFSSIEDEDIQKAFAILNSLKGDAVKQMPDTAFIRIRGAKGGEYFSLVRHKAHINMTSMFKEQKNRDPKNDRISLHPGFIGSYPNALFDVQKKDLSAFVQAFVAASTAENYSLLMDNYGIRRSNVDFWQHSDELHQNYKKENPVVYGLMDYNRLQNR